MVYETASVPRETVHVLPTWLMLALAHLLLLTFLRLEVLLLYFIIMLSYFIIRVVCLD